MLNKTIESGPETGDGPVFFLISPEARDNLIESGVQPKRVLNRESRENRERARRCKPVTRSAEASDEDAATGPKRAGKVDAPRLRAGSQKTCLTRSCYFPAVREADARGQIFPNPRPLAERTDSGFFFFGRLPGAQRQVPRDPVRGIPFGREDGRGHVAAEP